jgi:drug/metabolite transporter (DMT)-like permease
MNEKVRAHLALIGANLIFGITYSVAKHVIPVHMPPFALVFSRILGASILFWISGFFIKHEKLKRSDIPRLIVATFFGVAANQSIFLNGLSLTSPVDSAIIMTATPVLVLIVARLLLKEPVTLFKLLGIALGATGAILLIRYSVEGSIGSGNPVGNAMIVGNATLYAIYLVVMKPLISRYHVITLMKWIFLIGLLMVSGPALPSFLRVEWSILPGDIILSVLYVILGTTFLAYLLNNYSLKYVKPVTVSIYMYSQPLIATMVALLMGQDVLTLAKIFSAFLIFAGVYFVSYSSSRSGKSRGIT